MLRAVVYGTKTFQTNVFNIDFIADEVKSPKKLVENIYIKERAIALKIKHDFNLETDFIVNIFTEDMDYICCIDKR